MNIPQIELYLLAVQRTISRPDRANQVAVGKASRSAECGPCGTQSYSRRKGHSAATIATLTLLRTDTLLQALESALIWHSEHVRADTTRSLMAVEHAMCILFCSCPLYCSASGFRLVKVDDVTHDTCRTICLRKCSHADDADTRTRLLACGAAYRLALESLLHILQCPISHTSSAGARIRGRRFSLLFRHFKTAITVVFLPNLSEGLELYVQPQKAAHTTEHDHSLNPSGLKAAVQQRRPNPKTCTGARASKPTLQNTWRLPPESRLLKTQNITTKRRIQLVNHCTQHRRSTTLCTLQPRLER